MKPVYLYIILAIAVVLLISLLLWKYIFSVKYSEEHIKAQTRLLKMIDKARRITKECRDRIDAIRKRFQ